MWRRPSLLCLALAACTDAPQPVTPVVDVGKEPPAPPASETCRLEHEDECRTLCDRGDAESCTRLGRLLLGQHPQSDAVQILALFQRGCDGGSPRGCNGVGVLYQRGIGLPRDLGEAGTWYQRACTLGYGGACYNLGQLYRFGEGVPEDHAIAARHYLEACTAGDGDGCAAIGVMHLEGDGVTRDAPRAAALLRRACDLEIGRGCHNLAVLYMREGEEPSGARARPLLKRACKLAVEAACQLAP